MNPYDVLDIDRSADPKMIIQAAARALRERRFSAKEIAVAQKQLLDPVSRAAWEFLTFIDLNSLRQPVSLNQLIKAKPTELHRLTIFDEAS